MSRRFVTSPLSLAALIPLSALGCSDRPTAEPPPGVTAADVESGRSLISGQLCFTCHGSEGQGVAGIGPNLLDDEWLNTDGSLEGIITVITQGVSEPVVHPGVMLPLGGDPLITPEQVRRMAAYLFVRSNNIDPAVLPPGISITQAVVTQPLTGDRSALYLTVSGAESGESLVAASVDGVGVTSLHVTQNVDGRMSMSPVDGLPASDDGALHLRPGGAHGMLEELSERAAAWVPGDSVRITVEFSQSGRFQRFARVVEYASLDELFPVEGAAHH